MAVCRQIGEPRGNRQRAADGQGRRAVMGSQRSTDGGSVGASEGTLGRRASSLGWRWQRPGESPGPTLHNGAARVVCR